MSESHPPVLSQSQHTLNDSAPVKVFIVRNRLASSLWAVRGGKASFCFSSTNRRGKRSSRLETWSVRVAKVTPNTWTSNSQQLNRKSKSQLPYLEEREMRISQWLGCRLWPLNGPLLASPQMKGAIENLFVSNIYQNANLNLFILIQLPVKLLLLIWFSIPT